MEKEWFDSWFDSKYYPLVYAHRDYSEAERFVSHLLDHFAPASGSSVLDLACGRGRHSHFLFKKGLSVTGVDLSKESISDAQKTSNGGPPKGPQFLVRDMREPFGLGKFDYILNLFTSFGYFSSMEENTKVFANIREALLPGGTFVLDFMNAKKAILNLVAHESKTLDQGIGFEASRRVEAGKIIKEITIKEGEKTYHFLERVQALVLNDFETLARQAGFNIYQTWGDYNGNPFNEINSPRLILFMNFLQD